MKTAIIYVRGHRQATQEMFCRVYAADKGYKVLFVTSDLEAVRNCDTMVIHNASRIARDEMEYHKILAEIKSRGITVESAERFNNF